MIAWGRLARRIGGALATALLACALAACGGGGGGGTPTSPASQGGSPPSAESAYLLADFVAHDSNNQFVRVWDPANPGTAVEDVRIAASNGIAWMSSHLVFSDATVYDPATRTVRTLGHAKVFYDNDGTVYVIDLRGGHSHAPVQLSSVTDARGMVRAIPISADGAQAWVDVQGSASDWAVRADMAPTTAAQPIVALNAMRDPATGLPQYLFATFGSEDGLSVIPITYGVRDLDFNPVAVPAVDAMTHDDFWLGADPAQPGLAYVVIGRQVRALRWSAGGVGVDAANLYGYTGIVAARVAAADAAALYFADGTALLSVANATVQSLATLSLAAQSLTDAGGAVVAGEQTLQSTTCCLRWEAAAKTGGAVTQVLSGPDGMSLVGAGDVGLLFADTSTTLPGYLLSNVAGATLLTSSGLANGVVWTASARLDQPASPLAVLACTPDATLTSCVAGSLTELDLATGAATALGTLGSAATSVSASLVDGLAGTLSAQTYLEAPAGLGTNEVDVRDTWQLMPGSAGSLMRVTSNLP